MALSFVYYDPRRGLWSDAAHLAYEVGAEREDAAAFLAKQETYQRVKRRVQREFAPAGGPNGTFQADLLFMDEGLKKVNGGHMAILTVLNVTSRMAYARPLKSKESKAVVPAMRAIIEEDKAPIRRLITDPGTEFTAKAFTELLKTSSTWW